MNPTEIKTAENHCLKTESPYFIMVMKGDKTFEVRKNDRNFKVGQSITLMETMLGEYTGRELAPKEISYILHGGQFGIQEGYCVLGLKLDSKQ